MHGRRTPRLEGPGLAIPPLPAGPLLTLAERRYGPSRRTSTEADGGVQTGHGNLIQPRRELADYLGVTGCTIRRWAAGGNVTVADAERICEDLGWHPSNVWPDEWYAGIDLDSPDSDPMEDHPMFTYTDGGRADAGYRGDADDCAVRSIAVATQLSYRTVYDALHQRQKAWLARRKNPAMRARTASPRSGVHSEVARGYMADLGWSWTPTMQIGAGTTVHLRADELPTGRLVVQVSRHITAVIDGVVHDTHDPSREGRRAVYGYWSRPMEDTN